jgi:hypothetical protein
MIGAIYNSKTGRLASIIVPDSDQELADVKLQPDQSVMFIDPKMEQDKVAPGIAPKVQALISEKTGLVPVSQRFAVVDPKGAVVNVIIADEGYVVEGCDLIQSEDAVIGCRFDGKGFTDFPPLPQPKKVVTVG